MFELRTHLMHSGDAGRAVGATLLLEGALFVAGLALEVSLTAGLTRHFLRAARLVALNIALHGVGFALSGKGEWIDAVVLFFLFELLALFLQLDHLREQDFILVDHVAKLELQFLVFGL